MSPPRPRVPHDWTPMLATPAASAPAGDEWTYEVKWDGIRALARVEAGELTLTSRRGNDLSGRYPELGPLAAALPGPALLDGEIVAFGPDGRPSFETLQRRMHVGDRRRQEVLATEVPVVLVVFDLLWHDDGPLIERPYSERRARLEALGVDGPHWRTPAAARGAEAGTALVDASRELGLEGVVVKRTESRYHPGRRSRDWLKVKHRRRQELVVGGWVPGQGARSTTIGALLVGHHDDAGELRYAGRVGSGLTAAELDRWRALVAERPLAASPFAPGPLPREARFVRPDLVVEVAFTEWTADGRLRHPVYLGRRDDVDAAAVVRERPTDS